MFKKDGSKKHRGFTLIEMAMTLFVIGIITAITIPNFLRIKMQVNMELVKQTLKVIHETMNQIEDSTGHFPDTGTWAGGGSTEDELALTASLSSIDLKQYTNDEYYPTGNPAAAYQFRTCPKNGFWGVSGDKCFAVDSAGVQEVSFLSGSGLPMMAVTYMNSNNMFNQLFNSNIPHNDQVQFLAFMLQSYAINDSYYDNVLIKNNACKSAGTCSGLPSSYFTMDTASKVKFEALMPEIAQVLAKEGIQMYASERTASYADQTKAKWLSSGAAAPNNSTVFEIAFQLNQPVQKSDYAQRSNAVDQTAKRNIGYLYPHLLNV